LTKEHIEASLLINASPPPSANLLQRQLKEMQNDKELSNISSSTHTATHRNHRTSTLLGGFRSLSATTATAAGEKNPLGRSC
jgi:hypothetical protein